MSDTPETDFDEQDQAEAFDEDAVAGDDREGGDPDEIDTLIGKGVRDETARLGDEDEDGDEDAYDADEETDELLDGLEADSEEDDLDDDDRDAGALDADNIPSAATDRDFSHEDDVDGVSRRASDDAETVSMGDMDDLASSNGLTTADLESDTLSDADLRELDYKE